jgi:8-oxo-dGTP pyrophosphatase MutT (NUDIX family)
MKSVSYRAAGGVVLDASDRVLLLERDLVRDTRRVHEVRLPKGHVEAGESDVDAALREVTEESGYRNLSVIADLGTHANSFVARGERVTRHEHYYLLRLVSDERGVPTAEGEEALFRPLWMADFDAAERALTFGNEQAFVRRAREAYARANNEG